jgi:hypothetical protein
MGRIKTCTIRMCVLYLIMIKLAYAPTLTLSLVLRRWKSFTKGRHRISARFSLISAQWTIFVCAGSPSSAHTYHSRIQHVAVIDGRSTAANDKDNVGLGAVCCNRTSHRNEVKVRLVLLTTINIRQGKVSQKHDCGLRGAPPFSVSGWM